MKTTELTVADFGFVPGRYAHPECKRCGTDFKPDCGCGEAQWFLASKRSSHCLACAEVLLAEHVSKAAQPANAKAKLHAALADIIDVCHKHGVTIKADEDFFIFAVADGHYAQAEVVELNEDGTDFLAVMMSGR